MESDQERADEIVQATQQAHLWGTDELVQVFPMKLKACLDYEVWTFRGFGSFYELATAEVPDGLGILAGPDPAHPKRMTYAHAIGYCKVMHAETARRVEAELPVLAGHGGDHKSEAAGDQSSVTTLNSRGSSYLVRRLKRDHPEIAARLGEYRSILAAAIEAGIVTVPTPLRQLLRAWEKASAEERTEFLEAIGFPS